MRPLGNVMATDHRHVRDGARLQTATMAELVYCHIHHVNYVDRHLLLSDGLDDCRSRYIVFYFFIVYFRDCGTDHIDGFFYPNCFRDGIKTTFVSILSITVYIILC